MNSTEYKNEAWKNCLNIIKNNPDVDLDLAFYIWNHGYIFGKFEPKENKKLLTDKFVI